MSMSEQSPSSQRQLKSCKAVSRCRKSIAALAMTRNERRSRAARFETPIILNARKLRALNAQYKNQSTDIVVAARPRIRADCIDGPRPCPWVSCKYHLYLQPLEDNKGCVTRIQLNFPDLEVWEMEESCVLDVIERLSRKASMLEIARCLNLTRERVRTIEIAAKQKLAVLDYGDFDGS